MHWRVVLLLPLFLPINYILLLNWSSFVFLSLVRACLSHPFFTFLSLVSYPSPLLTTHVCLFLLSRDPSHLLPSDRIHEIRAFPFVFFSLIKRDPIQWPCINRREGLARGSFLFWQETKQFVYNLTMKEWVCSIPCVIILCSYWGEEDNNIFCGGFSTIGVLVEFCSPTTTSFHSQRITKGWLN